MAVVKKERRTEGKTDTPEGVGVVFELEYIAAPGRNLFYEMARRALKERGVDLLPVHVSKHGTVQTLEAALSAITKECGQPRTADQRLVDEVQRSITAAWAGLPESEFAGFTRFLRSANAAGIRMVALSGLEETVAADLASRLHFGEHHVMVHATGAGPVAFVEPASWTEAAGLLRLATGHIVALVSTSAACLAAMRAGLRCVAIPDRFTAYQDFGGADLVTERADERLVRTLLQCVGKQDVT